MKVINKNNNKIKFRDKAVDTNSILEQTVDALPDPIVIIDEDFTILNINRHAVDFIRNFSGKFNKKKEPSLSDIIGSKCHDYFYNKPTVCVDCSHLEVMKKGELSKQVFDEINGKTYRINISPIFGKSNNCIGTIHIFHDITDSENTQKMVEFQREIAFITSRVRDINELIGLSSDLIQNVFEVDCYIDLTQTESNDRILDQISLRLSEDVDKQQESLKKGLIEISKEVQHRRLPVIANELRKQVDIGVSTFSSGQNELFPILGFPVKDKDFEKEDSGYLGVILFRPRKYRVISLKEFEKFKMIAERFSLSIKKILLINKLTRTNRELDILNTISKKINHSVDVELIIKESLEAVLNFLNIESGAISLTLGNDEKQFFHEKGISNKCLQWAIKNQSKDIKAIQWDENADLKKNKISSCFSVPIITAKKHIGSIYICSHKDRLVSNEDMRLLMSVGSQIGIAIENAKLYHNIEKEKEVQKALSQKIIESVESERKRISMELHDNLLQLLIGADYILQSVESDSTIVDGKLEKVSETLVDAIDAGRKLIKDIMPPSLEAVGLCPSIEEFLYKTALDMNIKASFDGDNSVILPNNVALALYRIAQEAITNSVKHSGAGEIKCSISKKKNHIILCVSDNGNGFDLKPKLNSSINDGHIGLLSMNERAALCGGLLDVKSSKKNGTSITAKIPTG